MTSTAEVVLLATCPSAAALGTRRPSAAIIAAPPSSPHKTARGSQELQPGDGAGRRTCTDAREESVLWIGPVPRAHTLNAYYFAADEVCLAPSFGVPGYRQVEQSDKGARNGAIGKAVRLGACRCG
jgi:hypothetical protein